MGCIGLHVIAGLVELSSVEGKEVLFVYGHDDIFEIAVGAKLLGQGHGLGRDGIYPFGVVGVGGDLSDGVVVGMVFIIRQLVMDPQTNEDGDGHAYGETADVDECGGPVAGEGTKGDGEIIFEHGGASFS